MTVCFVDCETTGLNPETHQIWEVGILMPPEAVERVRRTAPGLADSFGDEGDGWCSYHRFIGDLDLAAADPIALNIGRFHERHPDGNAYTLGGSPSHRIAAVPWRAAQDIRILLHGCHLAGAVVSFDEERLRRLLLGEDVIPSWHSHLVDVEALASGYMAGYVAGMNDAGDLTFALSDEFSPRPPWDSNVLSRVVGVDPADFDRHTALGDAKWARALYDRVMGE